jgi:hypothetical protein
MAADTPATPAASAAIETDDAAIVADDVAKWQSRAISTLAVPSDRAPALWAGAINP